MVVVSSTDTQACTAVQKAVRAGKVVCLPTDTVYGVGADPFSYDAVTALLAAKSRTRAMPPPVLVASIEQAESLAETVPASARALMEEFWPGALTIILPARETLGWDLGETFGTVALRMPDDSATRDFLAHIGPLAVTSANKTGQPPATTIADAEAQLGESVAVYVDGGTSPGGVPSSIVRWHPATDTYDVVRLGALSIADLSRIVRIEESAEDNA